MSFLQIKLLMLYHQHLLLPQRLLYQIVLHQQQAGQRRRLPVRPPRPRLCHLRLPLRRLRALADRICARLGGLCRGRAGLRHLPPPRRAVGELPREDYQVLREAGYSAQEIARLKQLGILEQPAA
mgnify:CR=1 FL=1